MLSICSCVTATPLLEDSRFWAGSPGAMYSSKNVRNVIPSRIGTSDKSRFPTYFPMVYAVMSVLAEMA